MDFTPAKSDTAANRLFSAIYMKCFRFRRHGFSLYKSFNNTSAQTRLRKPATTRTGYTKDCS
jgi:hypothetical protein